MRNKMSKEKKEPPLLMTNIPADKLPPDSISLLTNKTFDNILTGLAQGIPVTATLSELKIDKPTYAAILKQIREQPDMWSLYLKSKEIGSELLGEEIVQISDGLDENGDDNLEDIARSKLRIDTRKFLMMSNARHRFAPRQDITVTNINLVEAMELAEKRVKGEVIDGK